MGAGLFRGFNGFGGLGTNNELLLILLFIAVFSNCCNGDGQGEDCNHEDNLIFYIILLFLFTCCFGNRRGLIEE